MVSKKLAFLLYLYYYKIKTGIKISDIIVQNRSLTFQSKTYLKCAYTYLFISYGEHEHVPATALLWRSEEPEEFGSLPLPCSCES